MNPPQQAASHIHGTDQEQASPSEHLTAPAGQPGVGLSAIRETEQDSEDEAAVQEQAEADYEERLQIGGGLLKQLTIKSGYLLKKGERRKTWKKRYFVLRPDRLCYYKDDREYQILHHIAVSEVHACAQVEVKKHENSFGIVTPKRTFYVKAESAEQADDWVKQINRARKEIEKRIKGDNAELVTGDARRDSRATQEGAIQASYSTTRPIPIRQAGSSGSPLPQSSYGHSYTDTSLFSTSESSNAMDHFMSSSYASNSSGGQSSLRVPHFLQDRLPIDPGRLSEADDMYDESAGLHRGAAKRYLPPPLDRNRGTFSSSEEDDEVDTGVGQQSPPPVGSLKGHLNPERIVLSGYLMKQGKRKTWRKRWFVLTSDKLLYARSHMDNKAHRCINLESVLDAIELPNQNATSEATESTQLPSQKKAPQNSFKIITPKRTYVVCAPSEEDEIKWISAIRVLLSAHRGSPSATEAPTPPPATPAVQIPSLATAPQPANEHVASRVTQTTSPSQYCSIESQLERATGRLQLST